MEVDSLSINGSSDPEHETSTHPPLPPYIPLSTASSLPSASPSASPSTSEGVSLLPTTGLPSSVRGAPEELKAAIRKNQNKESARRSRKRKNELVSSISRSLEILLQRTQDVEARLHAVETFAATIGFNRFGRVPVGAISMPDMGFNRFGHVPAGAISTPDIGLTEAGDQAGEERITETESELDAVQNLINQCIGQP